MKLYKEHVILIAMFILSVFGVIYFLTSDILDNSMTVDHVTPTVVDIIVTDNVIKTKWLDTNGVELQDSQEGQFPDDDGISDIDGYSIIAVETDSTGNILNIYDTAQ